MFATRRFRDVVGVCNSGLTYVATSVSTASSSGALQDLSKFHKYIYTLYATAGAISIPQLLIYSTASSHSSLSSASSNWAAVDSASCQITIASSLASLSTLSVAYELELSDRKLFSGVNPIRYIRPVLTCSSASNGASSFQGYVTVHGVLPAFGTAASQESPQNIVVGETDYL